MDVVEKNHSYFLAELENANLSKKKDDPVAVIIRAKYDFNGMLSASPAQSLFLQIAKTHRVVIKIIENANQFGLAICSASLEVGKEISLLVVMAHGYLDRIQFGREQSWYELWQEPFYQKKHILQEDFSLLATEAKIILYACATGQGIAQDISNISNKVVYAPMGVLWDTKTCLQNWPDPEVKIVSYNEKNEQHIQVFSPNNTSTSASSAEMFAKENNNSFFEMFQYLKKAASEGDANAQWKLGMLYLFGIEACPKSEEKAAYWLTLSACQGVAQAQFELGTMHLLGIGGLEQSNNEAGKWFSLSANQEFPAALFQMGEAFLNGKCGFSPSDEQAAKFFTLAAKKGVPQALFNLGVLYEHGRGVRRSLSYAKHIYEITDGLGISEAKARLDNLLQFKDQRLNIHETFMKGIHFLETLLKNMTSKVLSWVRPPHPGL